MPDRQDSIDQLLLKALAQRPELSPPPNLAHLAIQRARQQQARFQSLTTLARRARFITIAAGILLLATLALGCWQWHSLPASTSSNATAIFSTESALDYPEPALLLMLPIALICLFALRALLDPEEERIPAPS